MSIVPDYTRLSEELAWEKTSQVKTDNRRNNRTYKNHLHLKSKELRKKFFHRDKLGHWLRNMSPSALSWNRGCAAVSFLSGLPEGYRPHEIEISKALPLKATGNLRPRNGVMINDSALNGLEN